MTAPRLGWWWVFAPVPVAGLFIVAEGHVRLGGYVMAAGMAFGALLRLALPSARGGGLAVRSRMVDVTLMTALALALAIVTFSLK